MKRSDFLATFAVSTLGMTFAPSLATDRQNSKPMRIGIIGLDTSHAIAFSRLINTPPEEIPGGFEVVSAYPYGSRTIESSTSRIPGYVRDIRSMGIEIADTPDEVLDQSDAVLLLTNDGTRRREQAMSIIGSGKPLYMDKPVAASLEDVVAIYRAARQAGNPVFSSSSLRYMHALQQVRHHGAAGDVLSADAYSPAFLEPSHTDLFWYGIHGVETLFTALGNGCLSVQRIGTANGDLITGFWNDERTGTLHALRNGHTGYGGRAYGTESIVELGPYEGPVGLVTSVLEFFHSGTAPVSHNETLEIYAFMEAADVSLQRGGEKVLLEEVMKQAG